MRSKLRVSEPSVHVNDKKGQRKLRKMFRRSMNRSNTVSRAGLYDKGYAPPVGSNCYNRWAWLFRP